MVICDHKHVNDQKWYSVGEEFVVQLCFIYPKKKKSLQLNIREIPIWGLRFPSDCNVIAHLCVFVCYSGVEFDGC